MLAALPETRTSRPASCARATASRRTELVCDSVLFAASVFNSLDAFRRSQRGVASTPVKGALPVEGWLELKKGWRSYLDEEGALYLFDDAVFEGKVPHGAAVPLDATTPFGRWTVAATRVEAVEDDECDLASFVATGRFEYHVQCSTLTLAPRQGLRKCRPLQRLDSLTKSPRLRDVVPVPVGKGDEWVRVTVSFNVMYLYSQKSQRSRGSSAASRASRCRRAPRRPGPLPSH